MATADSGSEFKSLLDQEEHAAPLERGQIVSGRVVAIDVQGMIVDLGLKRDGVVPRAELDKLGQEGVTFEVGQAVVVVVTNPEDRDGNLAVSVSQGLQQQDWLTAQQLLSSQDVWEGVVSGHNRGGLIVQFGAIQAFVPASQVVDLPRGIPESERPQRMAALVGRRMGFKVIEVDRRRRRLVLSQRKAQREYREQRRAHLFDDLTEGQVRTGMVTALREFGAFVDLGGVDGLVHISELAWHRVKHPSEVLSVGQQVEVEVLRVDRESRRIGLSLKRRQADPWSLVMQRFQVGQVVPGQVTRVAPFGAFVDLGQGIEGLLHTSQWAGQKLIPEGAEVEVKILQIEPDRQRIRLALVPQEAAPASEPGEPEDDLDDGFEALDEGPPDEGE